MSLYFTAGHINNASLDHPEFDGSKAETLKRLANNQNERQILHTKVLHPFLKVNFAANYDHYARAFEPFATKDRFQI
ncbi:hypothetical protein KIL84_011333 [Mauremys mutica]|uniref:Uncharacterized protein n=1 Tax=Mauremys mutica TaxID=74926 RepID=A0A9D4B283_9SAUR|nr:hypothetical protein KIL84_011333 [Mauremys mutica]